MALMFVVAVLGAVSSQEIAPPNARGQFTAVFVAFYLLVVVGFGPMALSRRS